MVVNGLLKIKEFLEITPQFTSVCSAWIAELKAAQWQDVGELRRDFPDANPLAPGEVVFFLTGSNVSIEVQVAFRTGHVVIRRIAHSKEGVRQ